MRRWLVLLALLLSCASVVSANQKWQGYCQTALTGTRVTGCVVTVYIAGTLTQATIYGDNLNTPKSSQFTADLTTGLWFFYAANGRYDINFQGGTPTISPAYIMSDVLFSDPLASVSGVNQFPFILSTTPNSALLGFVRMAPLDCVSWRNNAHGADNCLTENGSDLLTYAGNTVAYTSTPQTFSGLITASAGITSAGPSILNGTTTTSSLNGAIVVDGAVNTLPSAINNAPSGAFVYIPPGTTSISTGITITKSNVHVLCAGINATKIIYTGGALTAFVDVGTKDDGTANQNNDSINGCTFSGNANTTYVLRTRGTHRSDFSGNSLINTVTSAIYADFAVLDKFNDEHTSVNEQAFTTTPVNCIIATGPDGSHAFSESTIWNMTCEGVSGDGIQLGQTSNAQVYAGSSEANARGINVTANSVRPVIIGTDLEANSTEDILVNGNVVKLDSLVMASTTKCHVGAAALDVYVFGGTPTTCTVDGGAAFVMYYEPPSSLGGGQTASAVWDTGVQTLTNKTYDVQVNTFKSGANTIAGSTGTGNLVLATSPVVTTPTLTGVTNGTGLQIFNTSTSCTTAGTINTPCTTAPIALSVPQSDTSYRVFCQGLGPTNFPQLQTVTKSNTTFTITLNNLTAAAATYASFDCSVEHN
jgi:hypothetical protein